jgi:hypothetical protein
MTIPLSCCTRSGCWHVEHLSFQLSGSVFHFQLITLPSDACGSWLAWSPHVLPRPRKLAIGGLVFLASDAVSVEPLQQVRLAENAPAAVVVLAAARECGCAHAASWHATYCAQPPSRQLAMMRAITPVCGRVQPM